MVRILGWFERDDHSHLGEDALLGVEMDGTAVAGEDVHGQRQAKSRSLARFLRGDEGLEDSLAQFLRNTGTVVADIELGVILQATAGDPQFRLKAAVELRRFSSRAWQALVTRLRNTRPMSWGTTVSMPISGSRSWVSATLKSVLRARTA